AVGVALLDRGDAQIAHVESVIRPTLAHATRHLDVGWRVVAEKRIARQRPDVTLFLARRYFVRIRRAGAVRQALNQMRKLVTDGLVGDAAHSEPDNHPVDAALAVDHGGAAQVLAR